MVEILPGATVKCGMVHVPVPKNELCFGRILRLNIRLDTDLLRLNA